MKHLLLIIVFSCFGTAFSQGIKLQDLVDFIAKPTVEDVRKTLEAKGWVFYKKEASNISGVDSWTWSYKYNAKTKEAVAWMTVSCDGTKPLRTFYEIFDYSLTSPFTMDLYKSKFTFEDIDSDNEEFKRRYATSTHYLYEYQSKDSDDGVRYECILRSSKADSRNGDKVSYYASGAVKSEYRVVDGKLNGKETSYHENGKLQRTGTWWNDKEKGLFQFYDKDGVLESDETYMDGKLDGPAHEYYPNGKVKLSENYIYGKRSGDLQRFDENGNMTSTTPYLYGKRLGVYKEFHNGQESFVCLYIRDSLNGTYTETLFDENDQPYAKVSGSYKNDYLDGTILAFYLNDKDTLSIRHYENMHPKGEWRYYDRNKQLTKRMRFENGHAAVMEYFEEGSRIEEILMTKTDKVFWYFEYNYDAKGAIIQAHYRVPQFRMEPNEHEFTYFESETGIFADEGVVDSHYKYGPYVYETNVLKYSGDYNEDGHKSGTWTRLYKKSGVTCEIVYEDGDFISEYFRSKKGKPYSGKLVFDSGKVHYSIAIKDGVRHGITEEKSLEDGTVSKSNYVDGVLQN